MTLAYVLCWHKACLNGFLFWFAHQVPTYRYCYIGLHLGVELKVVPWLLIIELPYMHVPLMYSELSS